MSVSKINKLHGGMTVHRKELWPNCTARRTHDDEHDASWLKLEPTPGNYDFSNVTPLANWAYKNDTKLIGCIGGTPEFYANDSIVDPYGRIGASSCPNNLKALFLFVYSYISFMNKRSAINPTGRRLMPILEVWNEPAYGFFTGTDLQMATITRVVSAAAKAADKGIIVAGPSTGGWDSATMFRYLTTKDELGKELGSYIDAVAVHFYGMDSTTMGSQLEAIRNAKAKAGYSNLSIASTERGFQPLYSDQRFLAMTHAEQGKEWLRTALFFAAQPDVICDVFYDWDGWHAPDIIYAMGDKPDFVTEFEYFISLINKTVRVTKVIDYSTEVKSFKLEYRVSNKKIDL